MIRMHVAPVKDACAGAGVQVWLKQPLVNLEEIRERHDMVESFVNDASLRQDLQQHLRGEASPPTPHPPHAFCCFPLGCALE